MAKPIRTRGSRAEFKRLVGRDATDDDFVVMHTDKINGLPWSSPHYNHIMYYFYDAAENSIFDGERYSGPCSGDGYTWAMRAREYASQLHLSRAVSWETTE